MYSIYRQSLTLVTSSIVSLSTFEDISSTGAAININSVNIYFDCVYCTFNHNTGNDRGGAIRVMYCSKSSFKQLCFYDNYAPYAPAFVIWSNIYDVKISDVNYTSEVSYKKCNHGSCPGGKSQSTNLYNNVSHLQLIENSNNNIWHSLVLSNYLNIEYSEFFNCSGYSLFGLLYSVNTYLNKLNIISCYSVTYFTNFYNENNNEIDHLYNEILFINTSITSLANSAKYEPFFQKCYADSLSNVPSIYNISDKLEKYNYYLDFCQISDLKIAKTIQLFNNNNNLFKSRYFLFTIISTYSD